MGLRFRKRVTILPGLSLNISKSGVGVSAGPRGAKVGVGPRGVHRSLGLPGTGIHYREETTWGAVRNTGARRRDGRAGSPTPAGAVLELHADGRVEIVGDDGLPLPRRAARVFREANPDRIQAFMDRAAERWNAGIDEILTLHLSTPRPTEPAVFVPKEFPDLPPPPFSPRRAGLKGLLWPPHRTRVDEENELARQRWQAAKDEWEEANARFRHDEEERRLDHETGRLSDPEAMERVLEDRLALLRWPRETRVSFQVRDGGRGVLLDVDLPEAEEMPKETAAPAARGLKLNIRSKSDTQVRREYMQHVHAVVFRIVGEVMHVLPSVEEVVASGYSQRPDPATGHLRDDYLLSARICRAAWEGLNFTNLAGLDVVACFEGFDLRRRMTKTGIFTPIEPHVEGDA